MSTRQETRLPGLDGPRSRNRTCIDAAATAPRSASDRLLLSEPVWELIGNALHLSNREFQIVLGVFDDERDLDIAIRLGVSRHTVHTYMQRLYRKLGVTSRTQLVLRVFSEYVSLHRDAHGPNGPG